MIVEIFAGTARVTAELRKIGMSSAFGTDHIRHKQAAAQVVVADLTTEEGVSLLMQWLADEHVVGLFIAPPVVRPQERGRFRSKGNRLVTLGHSGLISIQMDCPICCSSIVSRSPRRTSCIT